MPAKKKPLIPAPVDGEEGVTAFHSAGIRRKCHKGEWWFSAVDAVGAIAETTDPSRYWPDLKKKLINDEGFSELLDEIEQLKMASKDGKNRETDAVNTETLFRIIQSIPSKKAEPFKKWLAKVGFEHLQEAENPELAIRRAIITYKAKGYDDEWIQTRIQSVLARNELCEEWQRRGIEGKQFGTLTNIISKETFALEPEEYKKVKGIGKAHNLRDHMTSIELALTMLGETSTKMLAKAHNSQGLTQNKMAAKSGGRVAGNARKDLEEKLKQSVVSAENFLTDRQKENLAGTQGLPEDNPATEMIRKISGEHPKRKI